jgi:CheY-like chemotaxis protein
MEVDEELKSEFNELDAGSYVRLAVKDTGCGMSEKTLKRIFDPFFTTKAKELGTGLGLSVVQGIVKSHAGSISVQSKIGSGSTITILLPIVQDVHDTSTAGDSSAPRGTESILFVDNETSITEMGKRTLERLGYSVVTRTSSKEALELIRLDPGKFDLVITDQSMPYMTGIDLSAKILKIRPDLPIALCTGYSHKVTLKKAHAVGIRKLIMKPLVGEELGQTVREVLDESIG